MSQVDSQVILWQSDWNLFARQFLKVNLDRDQQRILSAIQRDKKVAIRSGTARGKDYIAAVASICFLLLNYPSKVINTAPTDRQVRKIMMPEIAKIFRGLPPMGAELLSEGIKFKDCEEWYMIGFKAGDRAIESWSGFHSPNLMIVVTEATGIAQEMFDAIEGILQNNSRLVLAFNPNRPSGYAYKATRNPQFTNFRLNSLNSTNVLARQEIIPGQVDWEWVNSRVDDWCEQIPAVSFDETKQDFK